jgi:transposase
VGRAGTAGPAAWALAGRRHGPAGPPASARPDQPGEGGVLKFCTLAERTPYADLVWGLSKVSCGLKPPIGAARTAIGGHVAPGALADWQSARPAADRLRRALVLALSVGDQVRAEQVRDALVNLLTRVNETRGWVTLFDMFEGQTKVQLTGPQLAVRFGVILRKVWGGSRTWAGARAQAVLMSVWRACWQQGRSALDFLSQLLRGPPAEDCAISGVNDWPAGAAVALKSRDRRCCWPDRRPVLH